MTKRWSRHFLWVIGSMVLASVWGFFALTDKVVQRKIYHDTQGDPFYQGGRTLVNGIPYAVIDQRVDYVLRQAQKTGAWGRSIAPMPVIVHMLDIFSLSATQVTMRVKLHGNLSGNALCLAREYALMIDYDFQNDTVRTCVFGRWPTPSPSDDHNIHRVLQQTFVNLRWIDKVHPRFGFISATTAAQAEVIMFGWKKWPLANPAQVTHVDFDGIWREYSRVYPPFGTITCRFDCEDDVLSLHIIPLDRW